MSRFGQMLEDIQRIKSEGFDPTQETYMERMSQTTQQSPSPLSSQERTQAKELFKEYGDFKGADKRGYIKAGEDNEYFGLDKATIEKNLPIKDGRIDREGEIPVGVDRRALDEIEAIEQDGEIKYVSPKSSNASYVPQEYYSVAGGFYDAVKNEHGGIYKESLKKQGEANLKYFIENVITDEDLQKYGFSRKELIDEFVQMK